MAEPHAILFGRCYPFRLSFANIFPLRVRYERKHLQGKVGDERAEQIFVASGVFSQFIIRGI